MKRIALAVVVLAAVVAGLFAARGARAEERTELWMYSAPATAPDDAEATPTYVGTMASGSACGAIAEAMTAYMRETRRVVVAFECRALEVH
jgi:hypothetical protein